MSNIARTELIGRLASIKDRIAAACARSDREASEVALVGVTKTVVPELIRAAIEEGLIMVGENRVQEAAGKISELKEITSDYNVEWHLIGHLQSNKARRAVELFDAIQTIDSLKLAERLDNIAGESGKRLPVFIEVNLGNEVSKSGIPPREALPLSEQVTKFANLELRGLMAVPPFLDNPQDVRQFFRRLRELRDEARRIGIVGEKFKELSMGMTNDFEVAIEEGATLVRIGTALFGGRI
ncbi:MAG: YggS family pyridoxal phosphate-dependent enzyme [Acidobacteria bacterium]|nr:YggS family pyridoxal phosphate-dependent enzyme [Acidobacteriota bacterium]